MSQRPYKSAFLILTPPTIQLPGYLIPEYPIPAPRSRISTYSISSYYSIRSSQNPAIFYSKLFKETAMGTVAKYPKGAKNSKSAKRLKGKPQLNGFVSGSKRAFDLDSNRATAAVNLHKIRSIRVSTLQKSSWRVGFH